MKKILLLISAGLLTSSLVACHSEKPAEKAGQKVDNAAQTVKSKVKKTFDKGPAEKAGEKMDKKADQLEDRMD